MKSNIFCIFAIAKKKMSLDFIDIDGIRRLDALLERCTAVTVTTHTHPDGDALGSASAFVCYAPWKGFENAGDFKQFSEKEDIVLL